MSEFGHIASRGAGFRVDTWGAGPFVLVVKGKHHRFEDSDQFGPSRVKANGDIAANPWWTEKHPFWRAHRLWREQGRRVEADGITCVWDGSSDPLPTLYRLEGRRRFLVFEGEDGGALINADSPEGKAAMALWYPDPSPLPVSPDTTRAGSAS